MRFPANLPAHLLNYLANMHLDGLNPAWVSLADDGETIHTVDGDWSSYTNTPPATGSAAEMLNDVLLGMFPMPEDFRLSQVETAEGRFFDIDIRHHEGTCWILFSDVTKITLRLQQMQQAANSLHLEHNRKQLLLDRHVGNAVAAQVLSGKVGLYQQGVRLNVCTMFMDIRSFTVFNEAHDAGEVLRTVNQYLDVMLQSVIEYAGHVDKITGDGAMVVFGLHEVEQSNETNVQQAFDSAVLIMQRVAEVQKQRQQAGEDVLGVGIGIASGDAVAGLVGTHIRRTFTVFGKHVNLAARLESQAPAGCILLDTPSYHKLQNNHGCSFQQRTIQAKGIGEINIWQGHPDIAAD